MLLLILLFWFRFWPEFCIFWWWWWWWWFGYNWFCCWWWIWLLLLWCCICCTPFGIELFKLFPLTKLCINLVCIPPPLIWPLLTRFVCISIYSLRDLIFGEGHIPSNSGPHWPLKSRGPSWPTITPLEQPYLNCAVSQDIPLLSSNNPPLQQGSTEACPITGLDIVLPGTWANSGDGGKLQLPGEPVGELGVFAAKAICCFLWPGKPPLCWPWTILIWSSWLWNWRLAELFALLILALTSTQGICCPLTTAWAAILAVSCLTTSSRCSKSRSRSMLDNSWT